jgi:hypothetical protein
MSDLPKYKGKSADRDLKILANEHNYEVVEVRGDGNCLFRAISKSLSLNQNLTYKHKQLREMVVEYLSEHPDFLEPYLEYVSNTDISPEEYAESTKEYIENMAKPGTWGDFICLKVLSEMLKVKFNLLVLNTRNFLTISNNDTYSRLVPLGFIDEYHYTALAPLNAPSMVPASIKPSMVPASIKPSMVPASIKPSMVPASISSILKVQPTPSIAPKIPPTFGSVKPLSSVNELLEIMDKVKPYVYDDISQLQKAERQIMVSLGM